MRPGDRVALMIGNVAEFPVVYFGILTAGAVVVPVHLLLTATEVAYVLRDSEAKLIVCHGPTTEVAILAADEAGVAVVPADPTAGLDPTTLIEWSRSRLPKHKYPRQVHVVDVLPTGPSHKVLKRELRETFSRS
ncbi:AMP-binding protein [Rhodococcus koreensis]